MGRPTKLTEAAAKAVIEATKTGMQRQYAAAAAGVTVACLCSWLAKGRKGHAGYVEFLDAVKAAEADFIQRNMKAIEVAGQESWQARAWLLERTRPQHFSLQALEVKQLRKQVADLVARLEAREAAQGGTKDSSTDGQGA